MERLKSGLFGNHWNEGQKSKVGGLGDSKVTAGEARSVGFNPKLNGQGRSGVEYEMLCPNLSRFAEENSSRKREKSNFCKLWK